MVRKKGKSYGGITNKAGDANRLAMVLFGNGPNRRMETPEQRLWLGDVLSLSSDPMLKQLSRIILNPMPEDKLCSVSKLAERTGITMRQITSGLKDLMRDEGFVRMAKRLPEVMEQVAEDAMSRDVECSKCHGAGQVVRKVNIGTEDESEERDRCDSCQGKGTVYQLGDTDRLRLLFETFDLTGKRGAGVNIDLRKIVATEDLSELSQSIAPLLEGTGEMK